MLGRPVLEIDFHQSRMGNLILFHDHSFHITIKHQSILVIQGLIKMSMVGGESTGYYDPYPTSRPKRKASEAMPATPTTATPTLSHDISPDSLLGSIGSGTTSRSSVSSSAASPSVPSTTAAPVAVKEVSVIDLIELTCFDDDFHMLHLI